MLASHENWLFQIASRLCGRVHIFFLVLFSSLSFPVFAEVATAENFEDTEIRVIRNKYFEKSLRLELSAGISTVMNQSFLYTYLGGISLGFHVTEQFGLIGEANLGQTVRKTDCEIIGSNFRIDPVVQEIQNYFGGSLDYSPIYGKFQLSNGRVVYFDWFLEAGGGVASIKAGGLGCAVGGAGADEIPAEGSALAAHFTTGQRIFVNERMSVNWRVRFMGAEEVQAEGNKVKTSGLVNGVTYILLNLGVSYFL